MKLPRKLPAQNERRKSSYHSTLWASLQSEFEKLFRRGDDLKDVLASVVGDNTELNDFRDTLLRMEGYRLPEVSFYSCIVALMFAVYNIVE